MSSQQLLLSWKEHNCALVSVFENLLKRNILVDCTLAADGQYLKAHKVVLSASSSYFELLFSQECEKNPIVILKDVKYQELEAAVNFMYTGEVEVFEDRLGAFMEVVDSLQIKGLSSYGKKNDQNSDPTNRSNTSVFLRQQLKEDALNSSADNLNEGSKDNINAESLSLHQPSWGENNCSPYPVTVSCSITSSSSSSSSSTIQQLPQSAPRNPDKCSTPIVSNFSSESVSSGVNAVIKTETVEENNKCDEYVNDVTMKDSVNDCGSKSSVCPSQQTKTNVFNVCSVNSNENSNHPVHIVQNINTDRLSLHQSSWSENPCSPYPISPSPVIPSTSSSFQGLPQSERSSQVKCSSTVVPTLLSSETVPSEVNAVIKTELLDDMCDEEFVVDATITEDALGRDNSEQIAELTGIEDLNNTPDRGSGELHAGLLNAHKHALSFKPTSVRNKRFDTPELLERHFRKYMDERPFTCEQCGKAFMSKHVLMKHFRIHTERRPYGCDVCGKAFSQMHHLMVHRRIHSGERPYGCELCGKSFARMDHFQLHFRTHTGERPYGCEHCGKAFSRMDHLQVHRRIHTGERPYRCDQCGSTFTYSFQLRTHHRSHTGDAT